MCVCVYYIGINIFFLMKWQQTSKRLDAVRLGVLPLAFLKWQQGGNSGNILKWIFIDKVHPDY
jgi:hypothetical protein